MIALASASRAFRGPLTPFLSKLAFLLLACPCALVAQKPSSEEQFFFDAVNRERMALQLPLLRWDAALAVAARQHAQVLATQHRFAHQLPGELSLSQRAGQAGAHFSRVAENIAVGPYAEDIHVGWMQSPGHRGNILDPGFTALGVGVIESKGKLYAVEDFSAAVSNLGLKAQEEKVSALLETRGVRVVRDTDIARQLCGDVRPGIGEGPMEILHYEVSDLGELPEMLVKRVREHRFGRAAVGACAPKDDGTGFTRFRIAVVLF
jgi:uncharacterized protein YkwD